MKKYGGDAQASLAAVTDVPIRQLLARLVDPDIQQSLAGLQQANGPALVSTIAYRPGSRERYTLSRLHATGGIGQVWLAHDGDLGRDVAFKELRPDRTDQPEGWARFLEEAQITGQLEHPGIVPVYELCPQAESQRPFYTMRFIKGHTLSEAGTVYHRRRQAGQAEPIELRELLNAFIAVCNAVAYAHSRGVIHRDLKGQNVVLGNFGEVMVLDWGLAKLVKGAERATPNLVLDRNEEHKDTRQGQVLGTPAYMAPEQAEGRLDQVNERSDVYGLGAILYQILTGKPPFSGGATQEILRQVVHEMPERPRALVATTSPALEAVCLKALSKSPADRYARAAELADEVRRWLAGEPVTAYPEPWTVRARRWVGRHRTLVTAGAAALGVALVCLTVALALLAEANQEVSEARDLAVRRGKDATQQRDQARTNFELAREAVKEYCTKVSNDPRLKEKDLESLRRDLLKSAAKFHKKFTQQHRDKPELKADLGRAYLDLADLTGVIEDRKKAITLCRQALAIFRELADREPDNAAFAIKLGEAQSDLANLLGEIGEIKTARQVYGQAIRTLEGVPGRDKQSATARKILASSYYRLGFLLTQLLGKPAKATGAYRKAIGILEELVAASPEEMEYALKLGNAYWGLGGPLTDLGKYQETLQSCTKAIPIFQRVLQRKPKGIRSRDGLASTYHVMGVTFQSLGKHKKGIEALRQAVAIRRRLADEHPNLSYIQQSLARDYNNLATVYFAQGGKKLAHEAYDQALSVKQKLVARHPEVPEYRADLARTLLAQGKLAQSGRQAGDYLRQAQTYALELTAKYPAVPQYQLVLALTYIRMGGLAERTKKWAEAVSLYRQALPILSKMSEKTADVHFQLQLGDVHNMLGYAYLQTNQPGPAIEARIQALAVFKKLVASHPRLALYRKVLVQSYEALGFLYQKTGQKSRWLSSWQEALGFWEELGRQNPKEEDFQFNQASILNQVGVYYAVNRQLDQAADNYRRAGSVLAKTDLKKARASHIQALLADNLQRLSPLFAAQGRHDRAVAAYRQAGDLLAHLAARHADKPAFQASLARTHFQRGNLYLQASKGKEAIASYRRAAVLQERLYTAHPTEIRYAVELSDTYANLSIAMKKTDPAASLDFVQRAVRSLEGFKKEDNEQLQEALARAQMNLGVFYYESKNPDRAIHAYRESLEALEKLLVKHPHSFPYQAKLGNGLRNVGAVYQETGRLEESAQSYRRSFALLEKLPITQPQVAEYLAGLATCATNLALSFARQGNPAQAATFYQRVITAQEKLVAAFPRMAAYAVGLGATYCNQGNLVLSASKPEAALPSFDKAIQTLDAVLRKDKQHRVARLYARNSHMGKATALRNLQRHAAAVKELDQAILLDDNRTFFYLLHLQQAESLAHTGDHARATAVAAELARMARIPAGVLYVAALVHAVAAGTVRQDAKLETAAKKKLTELYADRAVDLLMRARQAGFFKNPKALKQFQQEKGFETLKTRADFQKLTKTLENKS